MGVDWYSCSSCGDTFPDCGYFVTCEGCGTHWCTDECAEKDGYRVEEIDEDTEENSCKFCRGEDAEDYELVKFMLSYFNVTREEMVKKFYETKS